MLIFMITQTGLKKKLSKCVIAGAAALTLQGCASLKQVDQAIMNKEVPHMAETTLNAKMVKGQKPIDEEFLRAEDAMLNEICFSDLFALTADEVGVKQEYVDQKLLDYGHTLKGLAQRTASEYKKMEDATVKRGKLSTYEMLAINTKIWSYRNSDIIKPEVNGVPVRNQGLPEDTDLNAVRATLQHRLHKFMDAKSLLLTGGKPQELVAMEKYELGYGVFEDPHFVNTEKQDLEAKLCDMVDYVTTDIINYALYEFRHGVKVQDPAALEVELETLFYQMEQGLNAYGYQGQGASKDMQQYTQAKQRLVEILSQAPAMFGNPAMISATLDEVGSTMASMPLVRTLKAKGYTVMATPSQQMTANEIVK